MQLFFWIYWNPSREIFKIPYFNWPILWYSVLFIIGFLLGYKIFQVLLERYLLDFPKFSAKDVMNENLFFQIAENPKTVLQQNICKHLQIPQKNKKAISHALNALFEKDHVFKKLFHSIRNSSLKKKIERIYLHSFYKDGFLTSKRLFIEEAFKGAILTIRQKMLFIADRVLIYIIIATIIGARLGHLLFYEEPSTYLTKPWVFFQIWQGGLASHGATVAIIIALFFLSKHLKKRYYPKIGLVKLLDLVAIPTALAAVFIRIGNFFNQEIVGLPSKLPWAIVFGHPADQLPIVPRHPAQLYEAAIYLCVFIFLYWLSRKRSLFFQRGKMIGLFLVLIFGFRFLIEYLKPEQSSLLEHPFFLMGQYLSIPFILLGIGLFFYEQLRSFKKKKKE